MNILLGITGSIAAKLTNKLVSELRDAGHEVRIVATQSALNFLDASCDPLLDKHEWEHYQHNKKVLHIELRQWADVLLIAPCTANTLAKIKVGLCDNLLTNIVACWDYDKPLIIAPAMNTYMWENCRKKIPSSIRIVHPQSKELYCGETGIGAMAEIDTIISAVMFDKWIFPLIERSKKKIHTKNHPGAFAYQRHGYVHSGVDIYCKANDSVFPVECGTIVNIVKFTGQHAEPPTPWWYDTWAILVEGKSGVVCYGEILPSEGIQIGQIVHGSNMLGRVLQVCKKAPENPPPNHSMSMLHLELYKHGTYDCPSWEKLENRPQELLNPTQFLLNAI